MKIQKSNIGEPPQPLTEKLSNISKILDFQWSNPQKGTSIGHFTKWDEIIKIKKILEEKRVLEVVEAIEISEAAEVNEAA